MGDIHRWTETEEKFVQETEGKLTAAEAAKVLGLRANQVQKKRDSLRKPYIKKTIDAKKRAQRFNSGRKIMPESVKEKLGFFEDYNQAVSL